MTQTNYPSKPTFKKSSSILINSTSKISKAVVGQLAELGKPLTKATLEAHGVLQGVVEDLPVLAYPMMCGAYHCVNYTNYPAEPRFLNATDKAEAITMSLLAPPVMEKEVYLVEGLWDTLALNQAGLCTLGLPGANNKEALKNSLKIFKNKTVYILFDNDEAGKQWALRHAMTLEPIVKSLKILDLPPKLDGQKIKDVSDVLFSSPKTAVDYIEKLTKSTEAFEPPDVAPEIMRVILGKGASMNKSIEIAELIIQDIRRFGGQVIPYNNYQEFALIIDGTNVLIDEKIMVHLSRKYNYMPSNAVWKLVYEHLYNYAVKQKGIHVKIYSTSKDNACYVGCKKGGLLKITKEEVALYPQGEDGVYIKTGNTLPAVGNPDATHPVTVEELFAMFVYDGNAEVQQFLLKSWFYFSFFDHSMRPALCVTGTPGSGKTFLMKLLKGLLFGYKGGKPNPNSMPEEDHVFTLMMKEYKYLFLDEVNESNSNLRAKIRMLVTGEETVFRPKYARKNIRFRPEIHLALSAHSPRFRDADIAQRLCIIRLAHPKDSRPPIREAEYLRAMEKQRGALWRNVTDTIQLILKNLVEPSGPIPLTSYCRQIELAQFAWQAFPEERKLCMKTFNGLDQSQSQFSAEFDPLVEALEDALLEANQEDSAWTSKQLYTLVLPLVKERGIKGLPLTVHGFAQWLSKRQTHLDERMGYTKKRNTSTNAVEHYFVLTKEKEEEVF